MLSILLTTLVAVEPCCQAGTTRPSLLAASEAGRRAELPARVFTHWIHSHEEDTGGLKVFRTAGYKFPPARGRTGFEIKRNGDFIDHPIAPTDGNEKVPGTWTLDEVGNVVVTFQDPGRTSLIFQVVSCDGKVLKIKEPSSPPG